ncbi:helix-turn-helix domain-containing protein [Abyssalbus ytuae]|uniref:AraC family transcriptional regulator n=1 Tax=Abyssalbus ytuae TaxID=2926907 RepID=A0A9E6ZQ47_9FLAO|nr:helix-turn-helix domain-containing protein [Abyssalbus ytuae]UOB16728.1 AraC family transcriptional regulator [Abyssalbus ytuae]
MIQIEIDCIHIDSILGELNKYLNGNLTTKWGENFLEFNNTIGEGIIKSMSFDWGLSLLSFDVTFNEELQLLLKISEISPMEFIFISKGYIKYKNNIDQKEEEFETFQNVIISNKPFSTKILTFPKGPLKANFIQILKKEYFKKKNHNLNYLNDTLFSVFKDENIHLPYKHLGNYNLKIADQIKELNELEDTGIIRTLGIEGQLNLILAMQLLEYDNYHNNDINASLSKKEISKINDISHYIIENISEPLTLKILSQKSGLNPKKLQLGFRVLYSKSVNEYIRQLKLEIARDYLKNTDLSISEIVYEIGLKSRSYFSKIFYEKYGLLPMDYKKNMRKK